MFGSYSFGMAALCREEGMGFAWIINFNAVYVVFL